MTYWAIVRYRTTGNSKRLTWPSNLLRALELIAVSPYVDILQEGEDAD